MCKPSEGNVQLLYMPIRTHSPRQFIYCLVAHVFSCPHLSGITVTKNVSSFGKKQTNNGPGYICEGVTEIEKAKRVHSMS